MELDDGRSFTVDADQRDQRRAMLTFAVDPEQDPLGFLRATGWAAAARTGVLNGMSWRDFDTAARYVLPEEEPATADPTQAGTAG